MSSHRGAQHARAHTTAGNCGKSMMCIGQEFDLRVDLKDL